jgi:methylenetetrahydrofolate--tRNA-(uracil-5-)-methyltransferase
MNWEPKVPSKSPGSRFFPRGSSLKGTHSEHLAELVCSNSFGAQAPDRASGLLHEELRRLGSIVIGKADEHQVPAGGALAVDREIWQN